MTSATIARRRWDRTELPARRAPARRARWLTGLLFLFGCHAPVPPPPGLTASEVLDHARAVHDGPDGGRTMVSFQRSSRVLVFPPEGDPVSGELQQMVQPPDCERLEARWTTGHTLVQVVNGDESAEWLDGELQARDLTAEIGRRRTLRDILGRLQEPGSPPCRLLHVDQVQGQDQLVLERQLGADLWRVWIDAETWRLARILCSTPDGDRRRIHEEWLFDYEVRDGRPVATRHVTLLDGEKVSESWVLEHEEGRSFDADTFAVKSFPESP